MDLCNAPELKSLLARHGFRFSKSKGQNFLIAPWVPEDIAAASGADETCGVVEVGPGVGPLTCQLARRAGRVAAVELDRDLFPILAETLAGYDNVQIVEGDILKTNIPALVAEQLPGLTPIACANLPYNITSPALSALIEAGCFASITVMIQREAALRVCAQPGTADYGAFSVYCQYHTKPELLFEVPPECFMPAPKVTSAVVRLLPRPRPEEVDDPAHFFKVVRAAFGQRRKTLANALSAVFGDKTAIAAALESCGLPPDIRGERLSIPEFAALSKAMRE